MRTKLDEAINRVSERLIHFNQVKIDLEDFRGLSREEAEKRGIFIRDFGMEQWDWPQGVAIFSLHREGERYRAFINEWAKAEIEKGLPTKNVNTIAPILTLIDYPEYQELCLEWMEWIESNFPRTEEGGLQHITSGPDKFSTKENEGQIWIYTFFMSILFIAKMGVKYEKPEWVNEASYQLLLHSKYLLDRETALFYHGWNFIDRQNYGGNFWCRGNSWFTLGVPMFLEIAETYINPAIKKYILELYRNQVDRLLELRAENYLWHTILNDSESYTETSGSASILAGIYMGLRQGILDEDRIAPLAHESLEALLNTQIDEVGTVKGVSAGTPISMFKEDYKQIIQIPMVYGQATTILALVEARRYLESE